MRHSHHFDRTLHWDEPDGFTTRCSCGWVTPPAQDESVLPWFQLDHLIDHADGPPVVLEVVDLVSIAESLSMAAGALESPAEASAGLDTTSRVICALDVLVGQLATRCAQPAPAVALPTLLLVELVMVATEAAAELGQTPVTVELGSHIGDVAEWLYLAWSQAAELAAA